MRIINTLIIKKAIEEMCIEASCDIPREVVRCYCDAYKNEKSPVGKEILMQLIDNAELASSEKIPACQDTGMTVVFVQIGNEISFEGPSIEEAINSGVRLGYKNGFLRKSVVSHPLSRTNTKDNTPAVIYYDFVKGTELTLKVMPKGFGSENMSALAMLKPSDGESGVMKFIMETVVNAGPNACPPFFIGVGLGGTAEKAMMLAKKALLRKPNERSEISIDARLEETLIRNINDTGIGPAGLGGTVTVLDVFVESFPTHIAGLPVAVNICCHSLRHKERVL